MLKQNIVKYGKRSLEVEYEQMIIRANNFEPRNNTEYFIIDRQYTIPEGRFDLTGIFWEMSRRKRNQEVPVCLMEIKFALNSDIGEVHEQLARYYDAIKPHADKIADEMQVVFRQKIELGLYQQSPDRLEALKTLSFCKNIEQFQFILVLVDYNPKSSKLNLQSIADLPFAKSSQGIFWWACHVATKCKITVELCIVRPHPTTACTPTLGDSAGQFELSASKVGSDSEVDPNPPQSG